MLTYHTYKEVLPKELCNGIIGIAKELDSQEADVYHNGNSVLLEKVRNSRLTWLENPELTSILQPIVTGKLFGNTYYTVA